MLCRRPCSQCTAQEAPKQVWCGQMSRYDVGHGRHGECSLGSSLVRFVGTGHQEVNPASDKDRLCIHLPRAALVWAMLSCRSRVRQTFHHLESAHPSCRGIQSGRATTKSAACCALSSLHVRTSALQTRWTSRETLDATWLPTRFKALARVRPWPRLEKRGRR